ncbi:unnamed protein product, partial [Brassica oleracea]
SRKPRQQKISPLDLPNIQDCSAEELWRPASRKPRQQKIQPLKSKSLR